MPVIPVWCVVLVQAATSVQSMGLVVPAVPTLQEITQRRNDREDRGCLADVANGLSKSIMANAGYTGLRFLNLPTDDSIRCLSTGHRIPWPRMEYTPRIRGSEVPMDGSWSTVTRNNRNQLAIVRDLGPPEFPPPPPPWSGSPRT
jgi:hypothetical protein